VSNVEVLYTITQIETMYGYAPNTLTSVRAKGSFPEPDQQYGRTPLWRKATVDNWYNNSRRVVKS
jgi:hypothetical protein